MKKSDQVPAALVAAIFSLAALLRLAAVFTIRWRPSFDDAWYYRTAVDLASGHGYINAHGQPTAYFPVGYPAILSLGLRLLGASLRTAQVINVLFSLGTMACVYGMVRAVGSGSKLALLAASALGFLPNQIVSCVVTKSEITFTFALMLGVLLILSHRWERSVPWRILVGVVFGWATLIRPQAIIVPVLLVPAVEFVRHGGRHAVKLAPSRSA